MRSTRLAATGGIALFMLYVLGGVQQATSPAAGAPTLAALSAAGSGDHGGIIILDPPRVAASRRDVGTTAA